MTETYRGPDSDRSLGDLAGHLTTEIGGLLGDHLQLARMEISDDLRQAGKGARLVGGAAMSGWIAALPARWRRRRLAEVVDLARLPRRGRCGHPGGGDGLRGRKEIEETDLRPEATLDDLRDKQWIGGNRS